MVHRKNKRKVKRTTSKGVHRRNTQKAIPNSLEKTRTYETVLLNGIIDARKRENVTEYSLLFNSIMSTLTQGLSNAYYESGVSAGRALYKLYHEKKHYSMHEEGISDMVSFFEKAGYVRLMYNLYPDRIDVKFSRGAKLPLGRSIHVFESGIMSGFLSEAKKTDVYFEEIACTSNGSNFCHFISREGTLQHRHAHRYDAIDVFAESLVSHLNAGSSSKHARFSGAYLALSAGAMHNGEYMEHMGRIAYHLGSKIGSKLGIRPTLGSLRSLTKIYNALSLGDIRVISAKPLKMEVRFDRLKAKKEFVDISIAFLNGLLAGSYSGSFSGITKPQRNGSYKVSITQDDGV